MRATWRAGRAGRQRVRCPEAGGRPLPARRAAPFASRLVAAIAAVAAVGPMAASRPASGAPPPRARSDWSGRVEVGYDAFEERYSIVDGDTLDRVDEWRTRLRLAWMRGDDLRDHVRIEGRTFLGQNDLEAGVRLRAARRLGRSGARRLALQVDASRRHIESTGDFQFPNTITRVVGIVSARSRLGSAWRMEVVDRLERVDYARRTEFDADYARNRATLRLVREGGLATWYGAGVSLVTMNVPDSTEIAWTAIEPAVDVHLAGDGRRRLDAALTLSRRRYPDDGTRSSFWSLLTTIAGEWPLADRVSLSLEDHVEAWRYDTSDAVYFDYTENRVTALARLHAGDLTTVGAGAAWAALRTDASSDDRYTEIGAVVRIDHASRRFWFAFEYEPGRRRYDAWDPNASLDALSVYSDYAYRRLSLIGAWHLAPHVDFNVFLDWQPEDHEREGDDATATLFASSLSWGF